MKSTRHLSASIFLTTLPIVAHGEILHERPLLPITPTSVLQQEEYELIPLERQNTAPAHQPTLSTQEQTQNSDNPILQAIQTRDFATLERLLAEKPTENEDPLLRLDAQAALALHHRDVPKAIEAYQTILQQSPDSHGVRFDLAASLFQDKRYREAEREFQQVKQNTSEATAWQAKADQYLTAIQKSEAWQPEIAANYVQTNNVNNATENETFEFNGITFRKRSNDMPQSAQGMAYQVGVGREKNVGGHHFLGAGVGVGGVHYFGKPEFSEQNAHLEFNYRHKSAKQTVGISPFVSQYWVDGSRSYHGVGGRVDYARQLGKTWWGNVSAEHEQIRYHDPNYQRYYDGFTNSASARISKQLSKNTVLFVGAQTEKVHRNARSESSTAHGVHAGVRYNNKSWGTRLYVRYQDRKFDDVHDLFQSRRHDQEWRAVASIHHKKLSWKGVTPELNYSYKRDNSNIDLYDRTSGQTYVSLIKQF